MEVKVRLPRTTRQRNNKPPIWGWLANHPQMVIWGMVYGIGFTTITLYIIILYTYII